MKFRKKSERPKNKSEKSEILKKKTTFRKNKWAVTPGVLFCWRRRGGELSARMADSGPLSPP